MTSTPSTTARAQETAGAAQQEGAALARHAKDSGADVARTASDQASQVTAEAKAQATDLLRTTRDEVSTQVDAQRRRIVDVLRTTGDELGSTGDQSALTAELSQRASTYARRFADYLDERGPDAVLDDVRSFARRRPGTFLLLAGAAGVVAGRVFRSVSAASGGDSGGGSTSSASLVDERSTYSGYSDTTYSGLGVGTTETVPPVPPVTPRHAEDTAIGVAEVPPATGTVPTGYPVSDPYPPVDPYPATAPGYSTGAPGTDPAYTPGDAAYPAAPPGAPATEPLPPVDDPYRDPREGRP
ncbi:hypothetical protein [Cryptosporangium minutisporangium]|uniref:DUF3618 domain-containing protein n=1 Tax=Cryptosporangium minutisporangium TaxID=113569 RepID=A0ABP6T2D1_9ACTN